MDLTTYLPAVRQGGLITAQQARSAGLTHAEIKRLVDTGVWVRLRKSIYSDAATFAELGPFREQPLRRIRAVDLASPRPDAVFSHDSSSIVHGLGCPDPRTALVHRTRPGVVGTQRWHGVKDHLAPFHPEQVVVVDGLRVLDRARTALDMAREHGLDAGVACCDRALRLGTTREELRAAAAPMASWPFKRIVDESIELADRRAETWLESCSRVFVVKDLGMTDVEVQLGLRVDGRTVWCDLIVGRHVIEPDGKLKYFLAEQGLTPEQILWKEKERQDFLTGLKLGVSRLTMHDLGAGRRSARIRAAREYADTVRRFGTDLSDLTPYVLRRSA